MNRNRPPAVTVSYFPLRSPPCPAQGTGAPSAQLDPDGTVHAPGFLAPFFSYGSPEAKRLVNNDQPATPRSAIFFWPISIHGDPKFSARSAGQGAVAQIELPNSGIREVRGLDGRRRLYRPSLPRGRCGLSAREPRADQPARRRLRLRGPERSAHGIIPIASIVRHEDRDVVLRQGPENHFFPPPAMMVDRLSWVSEQYNPGNIGIFGCFGRRHADSGIA